MNIIFQNNKKMNLRSILIEHYEYIKNGKSLSRIMLDRKLKIEIPKLKGRVLNIGSGGIKYTNLNKNAYLIAIDADTERSVDIFADARYLPFKNNSIENVLCIAVLEHIYQTQDVINEIYRIMKSKGILLLWVPFLQQYHAAPNDYHRFTKSGVELMLKNNFNIDEIVQHGHYFGGLVIWSPPCKYWKRLDEENWQRMGIYSQRQGICE